MIRLICGMLVVTAVIACSNQSGGGTYTLNAGTALSFDSVTHGGSDIQAVKYTDTLQVLLPSSLTASSTSSTDTQALRCNGNIREAKTSGGAPAAEIVVSCPGK